FGYWGPELFSRIHQMDPVAVKSAFALNFGVSGLVGMLAFGVVSDRLSKRGMEWPVRLAAVAITAATLAILAAVWAPSFAGSMVLAIPAGVLGGGWSVGLIATLQYVLPVRYRASATALFYALSTLGGYLIAPWITGLLSQILGDDGHSLRLALTIVIPFGFLGALLTALASLGVERGRQQLAIA
ncbi:MAG: MFS transporter, partial [Alphaproteobacteria bacterium]